MGHLYFIIGILKNEESYNYKYYLAENKKEAKEKFYLDFPNYDIDEIKIISSSKKLIKIYENINKKEQ